jgi:hypothetical protein
MGGEEIENAITQLSPQELAELSAWLADYQANVWDDQIERDLDAGRVDAFLEEVDEEYKAGEVKPLCNTSRSPGFGSTTVICRTTSRI